MRAGRSSILNFSIGPAPDLPARRRAHVSSTPQASGVTRPRPVTTTLRMIEALAPLESGLRLVDVLDSVAHGHNGLGGIVGNFNSEFFLEGHDEFDGVEAVGSEIFDEGRAVRDLVGI